MTTHTHIYSIDSRLLITLTRTKLDLLHPTTQRVQGSQQRCVWKCSFGEFFSSRPSYLCTCKFAKSGRTRFQRTLLLPGIYNSVQAITRIGCCAVFCCPKRDTVNMDFSEVYLHLLWYGPNQRSLLWLRFGFEWVGILLTSSKIH